MRSLRPEVAEIDFSKQTKNTLREEIIAEEIPA